MKNRNKLKKIRDFYCYTDFFLNRGLAMFSGLYQIVKYTAFTGVIVGMVNELLRNRGIGFQIAMENVFLLTPALVILLMFFGILDVKKLHMLQKSNEISIRYNPYLVNLIKKSKRSE